MKAIDWLARTIMLVLAALATLALIGSLASVSDSSIGDVFPGEIAAPVEPVAGVTASDPRIVEPGTGTMTIDAPATSRPVSVARDSGQDIARWLKALTYAVLALAACVAAGVIALVRIAGQLGRVADR